MQNESQSEPVLISSLNEYVFCPRRCALKLIDGYREDNEHTSMGTLLHDHADEPGYETEAGVTLLRALPLFSNRYGLSGKADIVEVRKNFGLRISDCELKQSDDERDARIAKHEANSAVDSDKSAIRNPKSAIAKIYAPVEYKKGKRRKWDNDDVQLCAQAFCLEEMFQTEVPRGFIYHAASKRRREVIFDERLRDETVQTIAAVRALLANREVPAAILKPRCDGCSLREVCLPELTRVHSPALANYERELWR